MPPIHVSVSNVVSVGLAGVSGSPSPSLGVSAPIIGRSDQLRDRSDVGFTQHVSADIHSVPRSVSSFDPTTLLFPFSDSGFSSLSASAPPLSSFSSSVSSSFSVVSAPSFAPPPTVPIYFLPSVVPSVLSAPRPSSSYVVFFPSWSSSWFCFFCLLSSFLFASFFYFLLSWGFICLFVSFFFLAFFLFFFFFLVFPAFLFCASSSLLFFFCSFSGFCGLSGSGFGSLG